MTECQVKEKRTLVGPVRVLSVTGHLTTAAIRTYRDQDCRGLEWLTDERDKSCDPLLDIGEGMIFLQVRSRRAMADGAIAHLKQLRFLDAITRGRDPLDFSKSPDLVHVGLDDRRELGGLTGEALRDVTLSFTRRPLSFFSASLNIRSLKMQMVGAESLDLVADLPALEDLMLIKGTLESFVGMRTPRLRSLTIDGVRTTGRLDIAPLADLPDLRFVTITGRSPTVIAGEHRLRARSDIRLSVGLPNAG